MADTTQEDTDGQYLDLLGPALIALIAGLLIQSFIIGVNVTDWWKGRSVTPVDHIVTSLGVSRMCAYCAVIVYVFLHIVFLRSLDLHVILVIATVCEFLIYTNVWLTSLLTVVLCLKISNLHTRLFLYLRGMIIHRTGYLIVVSVLLSAVNSLMTFLITAINISRGGPYNTTMTDVYTDCTHINSIYHVTIEAFSPLLFYYISSVLLFVSLYDHTRKMKTSSNLSINLETYYSAMRFVSFTFIYNTMYFICHFACIFYYYFYCVSFAWFYIVLGFLPVLHSCYLIYRTIKLRSQMSKVLQNVIDLVFHRKDTETREDIEVVAL